MHSRRNAYVKDGPLEPDMSRSGSENAYTCVNLLLPELDSALDRQDAFNFSLYGPTMCAVYQDWPARSEDRSEVDSGTW